MSFINEVVFSGEGVDSTSWSLKYYLHKLWLQEVKWLQLGPFSVILFMFVYGLFNNADSSLEYITLKDRIINELERMWKEVRMA
jgi:hypothetical protein